MKIAPLVREMRRGVFSLTIDTNCIDIYGMRNDGGADLVILIEEPLDESAEIQTLLLDKIENYLGFINSEEFRKECPNANANNTHIVLQVTEEPPELIKELITKIKPWVAENNAHFSLLIK